MIAKINYRKTLSGVLNYNQQKVDNGKGKILAVNLLVHPNEQTVSVADLVNEFNDYLPAQITNKEPVIHISLNPHPDDNLNDDQYAQIAHEYMKRLGYGDQPYILYKHNDTDREHLHLVSLRVDRKGMKVKDSLEFVRSKAITEQLEKEFNLHPAKDSKQTRSKLDLSAQKPEEVKKQIHALTSYLIRKYSFQSIGELRSLLSLYNIGLEEVKGEANGKPYHGLVYCILNDKGEKITHPISSSMFGKNMGYKHLSNLMKKSTEKIKTKKLKEKTKKTIDKLIKEAKTEHELKALLKEKKIDVLFRRNEEGRIYGATFIDHTSQTVFNGSRLGKEYSANFFNEKFKNTTEEIKPEVIKTPPIPMAALPDQKESDSIWKDVSFNLVDFSSLSLPFIEHPKDEDVSYLYKKKKKKKRRPGRQD